MRVDPVLRGRQEDGHPRRVRHTSDSSPAVSVIISARNAAVTIADAFDSVLTQDYDGQVEVTVADGFDGPATAETVRRVVPTAHVVPNPDQHTAAGLNAARRAAKAPIVVRVDAHVRLPPGYLRRITATLARTGAANVGGRQQPVGSSFFTRAVAVAQTTLLGTGNARYRQGALRGPPIPSIWAYFGATPWRPSEDSTTRCSATRITTSTGVAAAGRNDLVRPRVGYRVSATTRPAETGATVLQLRPVETSGAAPPPALPAVASARGSPAGARIGHQCGACRSRGQEYRGGGSAGLSGHVGRLVNGGGRAAP